MTQTPRTWRVAYIGAGAIIKYSHIPNFSALPNVENVAICDVNEERAQALAAETGIKKVYADYRTMLAKAKPDITVVATPNAFHKEQAIAALEAGSHVLCEKPIAPSYAEAVEIFATAERVGRVLTVGTHMRFSPHMQAAKQQARSGFFGRIYAARTLWLRRSGIPGIGGWFTNRDLAMGGVLLDLGVHMLDRALYIMDYPKAIAVSGATFSEFGTRGMGAGGWGMDAMQPIRAENRRFDVEDFAWAFVRFETGAILQFQVSWAAFTEDAVITEVFGTDGGARLGFHNGLELYTSLNGQDATVTIPLPEPKTSSYETLVSHLVRHLEGDPTAEIVTPAQALASVRIVDAINRSAREGREVSVE